MTCSEKRITNPDLPLPGPSQMRTHPIPAPLGARHGRSAAPGVGGGYQDGCSVSKSAVGHGGDARLAELRRAGVGRAWQAVAKAVGYEAFLVVWQVLDSLPEVADERNRVCVPRWTNYLRYQRNLLVQGMAEAGATPAEIQAAVQRDLGETLSRNHVRRLIKAGRLSE